MISAGFDTGFYGFPIENVPRRGCLILVRFHAGNMRFLVRVLLGENIHSGGVISCVIHASQRRLPRTPVLHSGPSQNYYCFRCLVLVFLVVPMHFALSKTCVISAGVDTGIYGFPIENVPRRGCRILVRFHAGNK